MGYGTRKGGIGGDIRTFWPDDDENTLHIEAGFCCNPPSLQELLDNAQQKWPGTPLGQIQISAEHIHTDCIGYDRYDPSDYTDFIILKKF